MASKYVAHGRISGTKSRLEIAGRFSLFEFRRLLAALHNLTQKSGYQDIQLSFRDCAITFPGPMAALCAQATRLRTEHVDFALELPTDTRLRNLFMNAGWAYLIDPEHFDESRFRGYTHVPAVQFFSPTEQRGVVDKIVETILRSTDKLTRADLAAIEWAVNEITDNVLVHARSVSGGIVHLNNYKQKRRVELAVADAGVGIPRTLREGHPEIDSDTRALERAIREGITRDKSVGQGNGLFGTFRIAEKSHGYFHIVSDFAQLDFDGSEIHIRSDPIPYRGSLVIVGMDYTKQSILGEALEFDGQRYTPTGYVDAKYELDGDGPDIRFEMLTESTSFGSRVAGEPIRLKLQNLYAMASRKRIVVDFVGIPIISSSFADEVFGKLFVVLGPLAFMRRFAFQNVSPTVQALIDRAIIQRSKPD